MKDKTIDRAMIATPIIVWVSVFAYGVITHGHIATVVIASSTLALASFCVVMFVRMVFFDR